MKGKFAFNALSLFASIILAAVMISCAGERLTFPGTREKGVTYEFNNEKSEATVTGYYVNDGVIIKNLEIPTEITVGKDRYKVVAIADKAFVGGPWESVVLGANIRTIGNKAFENCVDIKIIRIEGNTPPVLPKDAFDSSVYESATLFVNTGINLEGTNWENFTNLHPLVELH